MVQAFAYNIIYIWQISRVIDVLVHMMWASSVGIHVSFMSLKFHFLYLFYNEKVLKVKMMLVLSDNKK